MLLIKKALGAELAMTWLRSSLRKKIVPTTGRVGEIFPTSTRMRKTREIRKRKELTRVHR